jgi:hypothetical protein
MDSGYFAATAGLSLQPPSIYQRVEAKLGFQPFPLGAHGPPDRICRDNGLLIRPAT